MGPSLNYIRYKGVKNGKASKNALQIGKLGEYSLQVTSNK